MFWIIVGIVIGVAFLASAFVLYIIGVGLKETEFMPREIEFYLFEVLGYIYEREFST